MVLVIAGIVFYTNSSAPVASTTQSAPSNQAQNSTTTATVSTKSTTTTAPLTKPAVKAATASITGAILTSSIIKTATSVQAGKVATTFTPTTKDIYAVLYLKNATTRTQLSYIRNFDGKYVDSKVSHPLKTGDKQFYFGWTLKAGQTRNVGSYGITFYVDGKKAQTISYTIR